MKSVITGATGLIGMRLAQDLDQPTILSRNTERAQRLMPGAQAVGWAPERKQRRSVRSRGETWCFTSLASRGVGALER